jgi:UDP-GlcNAc3NAcA epimerase
MLLLHAVGARPQFIKAAPLSRALREAGVDERIVHSGQHFDDELSAVFFRELGLPEPWMNLGAGGGSQAAQTGAMLTRYEAAMRELLPDVVLVHGDTNTTLAASLAAVKLGIPLAHNEAGLRSFNRAMPEEINRLVADRCADLLFCPTAAAEAQLAAEGIGAGVYHVGDLQCDALRMFRETAAGASSVRSDHRLSPGAYMLLTLHRAYTADVPERLAALLRILSAVGERIVFPMHPRTRAMLQRCGIDAPENILCIDPVGYFDMIDLEAHARIILTDSGGVQKEAYLLGVPCVTLRPETEWRETVAYGWNRVTDLHEPAIRAALESRWWPGHTEPVFGDGHAASRILAVLLERFAVC